MFGVAPFAPSARCNLHTKYLCNKACCGNTDLHSSVLCSLKNTVLTFVFFLSEVENLRRELSTNVWPGNSLKEIIVS